MDLLTNNNRPAGDGLISKTVDGIHELSKYSPEIGFALSTLSIYHGDSTNPNFGEAMKPQFCGWTCCSQVAVCWEWILMEYADYASRSCETQT